MSSSGLTEIARRAIRLALEAGAGGAECTISAGDEFSVNVRMGEVEHIKEAGSRGAGLRVLLGKCSGSAYTSDLTEEGIRSMVSAAMDIARITTEDPHAGLPAPDEIGSIPGDLALFSDDVRGVSTAEKIGRAKLTEKAAFDFDPRIVNSEGASVDSYLGERVFANSLGFCASYRSSSCSGSAVPVARDNDAMERDYWFTLARSWSSLEPAGLVGRKAAERAIRRLGARKIPTCKAPVVFEPRTGRTLIEHVFEAVSGDAVYRKASFLTGMLGQKVASGNLTVIDDGTLPGLFGTSPFDDEGVPSRRTVILDRGILRSYLLNCYSARKLGLRTTGNASRGLTGNTGVGHGNLFLENGFVPPEEIIRSVRTGLYVTELIGFGVNIVTGDYSRGAAGLWIENGELAYPVSEITIAGNLKDMLQQIQVVGNDLEFRGSTAAPTLMIQEMTISGQ